jgi:hypothetical protein
VLPVAAINRWGVAKLVPVDGDVSYEELAKAAGVSESVLGENTGIPVDIRIRERRLLPF